MQVNKESLEYFKTDWAMVGSTQESDSDGEDGSHSSFHIPTSDDAWLHFDEFQHFVRIRRWLVEFGQYQNCTLACTLEKPALITIEQLLILCLLFQFGFLQVENGDHVGYPHPPWIGGDDDADM